MSKYPRIQSTSKLKQKHNRACLPCKKLGNDEEATTSIRLACTYMRGDDEFSQMCDRHYAQLKSVLNKRHWPKHLVGEDVWKD